MSEEIIAKELLEWLVCPACKQKVELCEYQPTSWGLRCQPCRRIYPIREGIPIMLIEEAIPEK